MRPRVHAAELRTARGSRAATEELNTLLAHFDALAKDKRQIVFLTGETGIGKTALMDAFCRTVESMQGAAVVRGQCAQGFADREAYYPVMEALAELCAPPHEERMKPLLARKAPSWLAALDRQTPEGITLTQERAMSDLCSALETMAAETPLVLVLEDLHWADGSTLNLIAALARRRTPTRLMLLATVGPHNGEAVELKRVKHDLRVHGLCAEIPLGPLRPAQVERYCATCWNRMTCRRIWRGSCTRVLRAIRCLRPRWCGICRRSDFWCAGSETAWRAGKRGCRCERWKWVFPRSWSR